MFSKIIRKKTSFHVQLLIGLIPSHKESPNFWHVISQHRNTLYWSQIVRHWQGSTVRKIPNDWISPILDWILGFLGKSRISDQNTNPYVWFWCFPLTILDLKIKNKKIHGIKPNHTYPWKSLNRWRKVLEVFVQTLNWKFSPFSLLTLRALDNSQVLKLELTGYMLKIKFST